MRAGSLVCARAPGVRSSSTSSLASTSFSNFSLRDEGSLGSPSSTSMPCVPMVVSRSSRSSGEWTVMGNQVIHLVVGEITLFLSCINEFRDVAKSQAESLSAPSCMEVRLCVGQQLITFALASYRTQGKQDWFSLRSLRSYIVRR